MMKKSNSILILNKLIEAQNAGCCVNVDITSIRASIYMPYINVNTYGNNVIISSKAGSVEFDANCAYEKDGVIIADNDIIIDIIE